MSKKEKEPTEKQKAAEAKARTEKIARETMTGDLRDILLDFLKHDKNPLPWNMQGEKKQREIVERVETAVARAVERSVEIFASEGRPCIQATLDQVTIKDGIKAVLSLSKSDPLRHALVDAQGLSVLIVISDAAPFIGEKAPVHIEPDQKVLPGTNDEDADGEGIEGE